MFFKYLCAKLKCGKVYVVRQMALIAACQSYLDPGPLGFPTDMKNQSLFHFNVRRDMTVPFSSLEKEHSAKKRGQSPTLGNIYLKVILVKKILTKSNEGQS